MIQYSFHKAKSAILVLTVLIFSSANLQAQKLFTIDSLQLSNANQNFVYAQGCKEIKDTLFIALDTALSIIESQKLQINALGSAQVKSDTKYLLCEEDVVAAKKQAKKEKAKRTGNAILFYASMGLNIALVVLYLAK